MSDNEETIQDDINSIEPAPKKIKVDDPGSEVKARASGGADSLLALSDDTGLHLIDEVQDEENSDQPCSESDSYDSEIPEEEIDALLEEGLPEEMKGPRKQIPKTSDVTEPYEMKEKVFLIEKGSNPFEILPEGWVQSVHSSGMPVYLHKESRVCTFSKPYFLGSGSVRKHDVPLGAIPCLQYLRALEKEMKRESELMDNQPSQENSSSNNDSLPTESSQAISNQDTTSEGLQCPFANKDDNSEAGNKSDLPQTEATAPAPHPLDIHGANSNRPALEGHSCESLEPTDLLEYCQKRFQFKKAKLFKFRSWAEKRKYQKKLRKRNRPLFPEGTSLLSIRRSDDKNNGRKEWIINPKGKSYICILHEYLQQALKTQPKYLFSEVDNALTPYSATLEIGDIRYCTGYGSSKKQAKMEAAKNTLKVLLPEFGKKFWKERKNEETDLSFFDEIRIGDQRVPDLCNKASELSPYTILLNCLQRNFGLSGNNIQTKLVTTQNNRNVFVMTVGKHTVEVKCKNKKDGKHTASQAILQKLHPHIDNWGSVLRLYGNRSLQSIRERKPEMQEITLLQTNATSHQPNTSIIKKLKEEMLKLSEVKAQIQPIGKFLLPDNLSFPTKHGSELNNVDL